MFGCSRRVKTEIKNSSGSDKLLWVVGEGKSLDSLVSNVDMSEPSPQDDVYSADNLPGETAAGLLLQRCESGGGGGGGCFN